MGNYDEIIAALNNIETLDNTTTSTVDNYSSYLTAKKEFGKSTDVLLHKAATAAKVANAKKQILNNSNDSKNRALTITSDSNRALNLDYNTQTSNRALTVEPDTQLGNAAIEVQQDNSSLKATSPVISSEGPVSKHADGTYSVTTAEGQFIPGLNELDAKTFAGYNQEDLRARQAGAPTTFLGTKANAIIQTTVDLGTQAASAFTTDPENLKAIKDFGENLKSLSPVKS